MIASLHGSIARVVRKTLQFIGMVGARPDPIIFEKLGSDRTGIERYIQSLINGYNAHGAARMEDYRVVELSQCRERAGAGKEYISAKVIGPGSPFYIIFQRTYGPVNSNKPTTSAELSNVAPSRGPIAQGGETLTPGSNYPIQTGIKSASYLEGPHIDDIAFTALTRKTDEVLKTITFHPSIPLYTMAVLASTVHHSPVDHDSTTASSYFYVSAIMEVAEEFYSAKISSQKKLKPSWEKVGRSPTLKIPDRSGTTKIQPDVLQSLIASYKVDLESFENHVRSVPFFGMQR